VSQNMSKEVLQWIAWAMVVLIGWLWWSRRSANRRRPR